MYRIAPCTRLTYEYLSTRATEHQKKCCVMSVGEFQLSFPVSIWDFGSRKRGQMFGYVSHATASFLRNYTVSALIFVAEYSDRNAFKFSMSSQQYCAGFSQAFDSPLL